MGTIGLLFAVAWIILQDKSMLVGGFIPENVANIINCVIGYGLLIFIIVLIAMRRVKFWDKGIDADDLKEAVKQALKEDKEEQAKRECKVAPTRKKKGVIKKGKPHGNR